MIAVMLAQTDLQYDAGHRVAKESAPSEAVITKLKQAVEAFISLGGATAGRRSLYRDVVSGIRRLAAAVRVCEAVGIEPREIRGHLTPARLLHRRSSFVARAQDWPRGYPGDFETIEYLCDGRVRVTDEDAVGYCIENYTFNTGIVRQHYNKIRLQAGVMLACCLSQRAARVLSIGCGGARDLRMIADRLRESDAEFVLCDADAGALELARAELGPLRERCTFVHGKVPRVVTRLKALGRFDLVVAGGLFDYLPERWVELMVGEVWRHLLNPGGMLFFTNIAAHNPYRFWMEYLADWSLIERTEGDIIRLCRNAGVAGGAVSVTREGTNLTLIARVVRPSNRVG